MNGKLVRTGSALLALAVAALLIWGFDGKPKIAYYRNEGKVFGTYYNIRYSSTANLEDSIKAAFADFDGSMSMFTPHSILSAVNANHDTVTNMPFERMWAEAVRVNALSDGAFDITVAPLVNYWGFGRKERQSTDRSDSKVNTDIDSILQFVGFEKVQLVNHKIVKSDPRVMIDAGAVAKGQACDVIADLLRRNGCDNYLVDIGGEVVCHGVNDKGNKWHVGITKPNLNNEGAQDELQDILAVNDICMATSGNYRNYYYEGNQRRSHTIDPRTGYPVQHSVLSATVVSSTCMRADALATACMVLGAEKALDMIARANEQDAAQGTRTACYLLVAENDSLTVVQSDNWDSLFAE